MLKTKAVRSAFALLVLLASSHVAKAQLVKDPPVGRIVRNWNATTALNIGQRRSIADGNRASLRALARLAKRYPRDGIFRICWSVRLGRGPLTKVSTFYVKPEQCVMREDYSGPETTKTIQRIQYDNVLTETLLKVVRKGGSFRELERAAGYSLGQQYWR